MTARAHFPGRHAGAPYCPPPPDVEPIPLDELTEGLDAVRGIGAWVGGALLFWAVVGLVIWWARS